MFNSYAEATAYYKACVDKQMNKITLEVKRLREFEALLEHNRNLMNKYEADTYG